MIATRRDRFRQIEKVSRYSSYYLGKCYTWASTPMTETFARWRLHPNVVTILSLLLAVCAAVCFGFGRTSDVRVGAVLLYVSYVLDWSDGQLARFTGKVSPFGGWLDQISDRTKEFLYIGSIAVGGVRTSGDERLWIAALLALFFLFLLEYYGQMSRAIPEPSSPSTDHVTAKVEQVADVLPHRPFVVDFSIDEQYAFVVVVMLIGRADWTLWGIVVLAGLFAIYKPLKAWMRYFRWKRGTFS